MSWNADRGPGYLATLIFGESMLLALVGAGLGVLLLFPVAHGFGAQMGTMFPVFAVAPETVMMQTAAAVAIGIVAAVAPTLRAMHVNIVDGLRSIG